MEAVIIARWNSFFMAEVGAAAALAGLLFVAISINVGEILKDSYLPMRAGQTIGILIASLVEASLVLMPGQTVQTLGTEVLVVGALMCVMSALVLWRSHQWLESLPLEWRVSRVLLWVGGTILPPVAGVALLAGGSWGLYVLAAAILVAFLVAALNAWVFLVEILR
jgi:hypothetical protein